MHRNNRFKCILVQFSYDHRKLDRKICCIRKSMDELAKMLDCMCPKKKNAGEK